MTYKHGVFTSEQATGLIPMTETDAGLIVAFGTAPVHLASDRAQDNTPVLCYTYKEAVAALGYSDDWEKYTLCEAIYTHFALYNMAPIVLVNCLSPKKHTKKKTSVEIKLTDGSAKIDDAVLLETLQLSTQVSGQADTVKGTDYTAAYNDDEEVVLTALDGGKLASANTVYATYTALDSSTVTADDIVGGVSTETGASSGLELLDEVYPRFGIVPGIVIAPGWSDNAAVAAVMKAKAKNIDTVFQAITIHDAADSVTKYSDVSEWKNKNNFTDTTEIVCWPRVKNGGKLYHLSTQMASLMNQVDSENKDIPYYSPSNHSLQADGACLADGTDVYLNVGSAGYLNGQGVITALNFIGGWKLWGNRTAAYPSNTDPKDAMLTNRRMFNWVGNTLVTSFWSKIDNPANKRLIATVVDSANIWLNGLTASECLLGGRVEFRSDENTTTDLEDGKLHFHVYITPPSPAREIDFIQEYDPSYMETLFD